MLMKLTPVVNFRSTTFYNNVSTFVWKKVACKLLVKFTYLVNFINILQAIFVPIVFRQKIIQSQTVIREKLHKSHKALLYEKAVVYCWWNWHLVARELRAIRTVMRWCSEWPGRRNRNLGRDVWDSCRRVRCSARPRRTRWPRPASATDRVTSDTESWRYFNQLTELYRKVDPFYRYRNLISCLKMV